MMKLWGSSTARPAGRSRRALAYNSIHSQSLQHLLQRIKQRAFKKSLGFILDEDWSQDTLHEISGARFCTCSKAELQVASINRKSSSQGKLRAFPLLIISLPITLWRGLCEEAFLFFFFPKKTILVLLISNDNKQIVLMPAQKCRGLAHFSNCTFQYNIFLNKILVVFYFLKKKSKVCIL